jgi:sec-independent protein translocase protein TatB
MGTPPTIQVASLGMADSLILMVLALVVFGPRRLPQIGRQLGKLMYEFRKASNDFKFQMEEELRMAEEADRRKQEDQQRAQAALTAPAATPTAEAPISSSYDEAAQFTTNEAATEPGADTGPRIQPPSTGEPVAASKTGAAAALDAIEQAAEEHARKRAAEVETAEAPVSTDEPPTPQTAPATEAASHNG